MYPEKVLKTAIENLQKKIDNDNAILASTGHVKEMAINNISHIISDVWFNDESKTGQCNLKVIPTTEGRTVKTILDHGGKLSLSMSGIGTMTKKENYNEVNSDFELKQIDIVVSGGFENAGFSKKDIIGESLDVGQALKDNKKFHDKREKIIQRVGEVKEDLKKPTAKQIEEKYKSLYEQAKKADCKLTFLEYKEKMSFGEDAELKERYRNDKENAGCKLTFQEWVEKFG